MIPVITSLLDNDFYTFTVGQLVLHRYRGANVTYAFINRTRNVNLADFIPEKELRGQLDHVRSLRFKKSELDYLRSVNNGGARMFEEDYLEFLRSLRLPSYNLTKVGNGYNLEFPDAWEEAIYWEIPALRIVNTLYFQSRMRALSRFQQHCVFATGKLRLAEKIKILRQRPDITFSDFGTRRSFSPAWQDYVLQTIKEEIPRNLLGTSNVKLAMRHGLMATGTSSHQVSMILSGILRDRENPICDAQRAALLDWWDEYGQELSIYLPDTWGTKFGFSVMPAKEASDWKGFRQDSGDPIEIGEIGIQFYKSCGVDPAKKLAVFSDGLTAQEMIRIADHFKGRIRCTFGWGTNLTNDLGVPAISIVIKPVLANGHPVVKLSDNLAKATGDPDEIERAKLLCGYTSTLRIECKY